MSASAPLLRSTLAGTAALLAALLLAGCKSEAVVAPAVRPAIVTQPRAGDALGVETYSGALRARRESVLGFRVGGKVQERQVDVGARVRKGEVLATLEPEDASLAVSSANAQYAWAKADLALAKSELDRHASMLEKKYIPQSLYDARRNAWEAAQARVEQARAQLAVARNQSEYTSLRADHDGVITATPAEVGQVVASGQPVVSLAHDGEIEVVVNVPESRVGGFTVGQPVLVEIWAEANARYSGKVREVAPQADPVSRTYEVRVTLLEPNQAVQLGMTARIYLDAGQATGALLLPLTAVTETGKGHSVWVYDTKTKKVRSHPVRVGAWREDGVSVLDGLTEKDWVVAAGVHKLVEGQTVRPVDADNKPLTP